MRSYLLVDDNQALADNLAEILREGGDEAVVVTVPEEALEQVRRRRFDALITDMRMPVMNGTQLVREARQIDPGLPVVVLTAYTGEGELSDVLEEGILAILPKPVPIERLLSLVSSARRDGLVAVIEDDRSLADNLVELLRARGFAAVLAHSADEAERLKATHPFVAVVDVRIPGSPKGEVLARLAQHFAGMPFVVITAFRGLDLPIVPAKLFEKPFPTAQLLQTLEGLHRGEAGA